MQKRKVILSQDMVLWESGDRARTFAIVESGRLGVKTSHGLAGIVAPKMVVGESALLALDGEEPKRTGTVFALEEGTTVVEYPPLRVKQAVDEQAPVVWRVILTTLLGHVCRNNLLIISARSDEPFYSQPFRSMTQALIQTHRQKIESLQSWNDFSVLFHFLFETRGYSETMLRRLVPPGREKELVVRASATAQELLKGQAELPFLGDLLETDNKLDWLERSYG